MSAFTKLRESDFSATEKRIADYILKNAHKLPEITISTVAKDCDTSKSMVVQLCKTAGFKGYKDLCSQLLVEQALSDQKGQEAMDYDEIHPGCTMAQICQITLREEMRSLQDTAELMDASAIEKAVQAAHEGGQNPALRRGQQRRGSPGYVQQALPRGLERPAFPRMCIVSCWTPLPSRPRAWRWCSALTGAPRI